MDLQAYFIGSVVPVIKRDYLRHVSVDPDAETVWVRFGDDEVIATPCFEEADFTPVELVRDGDTVKWDRIDWVPAGVDPEDDAAEYMRLVERWHDDNG